MSTEAQRVRRLTGISLAASVVSICAVHGPLIGYKAYANPDEAYAMALAERLLEGYKLYDGAVSQRGPLMYYAFEGIAWLHGWDNVVAFRLWALAFALAHLGLVWIVARRALSKRAAIVATTLTGYALAFGFPALDGYALHGETLQLPAMLVGAWLGAIAMRHPPRHRSRWLSLAGAGLLFGVAASIKQSVLLHPLAIVVWIAVDAHRRRSRAWLLELVVLGACCLVVPTIFVVHSASEGTLSQMIYYTVTYNSTVHLQPTTRRLAWLPNVFFRLSDQTGFFFLLGALLSSATPHVLRRVVSAVRLRSFWALFRGWGPTSYFALHALIALASAAGMWRFFPHYFLQAWPFVAIWTGGVAARWMKTKTLRARLDRLTLAVVALLIFCGTLGTVFGERIDGRIAHDRTVQDLGRYLEASTAKEDRIFVWGFSPWLYEYSHRRPAGRYVFETYVTGMVPWFWEKLPIEQARIVPGSVEALLQDLDRERPAVVVDAGAIMLARPMRGYKPFSDWLHASYCFELRLGALDVYRRKLQADTQCAEPYYPYPHVPVDWNGRFLGMPIPRQADQELTRRLPEGNYFKPIWFPSQTPPAHLDALRDSKLVKEEQEAADQGFLIEGEGANP